MTAATDTALDRQAVDLVARAVLLRNRGPATSVRSYRDDLGGLVVVARLDPSDRHVSDRWLSNCAAYVEQSVDGALQAGGFSSSGAGMIAFGFEGTLPQRRWSDTATTTPLLEVAQGRRHLAR